MLRIRLRRVGKKGNPSYRIVVADSAAPRDGAYLEWIGNYDPMADPPAFSINEARAAQWLSQGAQPSDAVARILDKNGILERTPLFRTTTRKSAVQSTAPVGAPTVSVVASAAPADAEPAADDQTPEEPAAPEETPEEVPAAETDESPGDADSAEEAPTAELDDSPADADSAEEVPTAELDDSPGDADSAEEVPTAELDESPADADSAEEAGADDSSDETREG